MRRATRSGTARRGQDAWALAAAALALASVSAAAVQPSPLAAHERELARLELVRACRWPFARSAHFVPVPDVVTSSVRPARLVLGGYAYDPDLDVLVPGAARAGLPFAGMQVENEDGDTVTGRLELLGGRVLIGVRLRSLAPGPPLPLPAHGPDRELARAWRRLPVPAGPRLELELRGLRALLQDPDDAAQLAVLLDDLLLARFRGLGSADVPRRPPGLRGLEGLEARARAREQGPLREARPSRHTRDAVDPAGFGLFDLTDGSRVQLSEEPAATAAERAHRRLLARLVADLRWPLGLPEGWQRVRRRDDGVGRFGLEAHDALDLGSTLWHPEHGFGCLAAGSHCASPLQGASLLAAPPAGMRGWIWEAEADGYRLRVLAAVLHVDASGCLTPVQRGVAFGGFRSSEPGLRAIGLPKGCHAHLEWLGLFEGAPARRADFVRFRLTPALWRAPVVPTTVELERAPLRSAIVPELQALVTAMPRLPGARIVGEHLWLTAPTALDPAWRRGRGGASWQGGLGAADVRFRLEGPDAGVWPAGRYALEVSLRGPLPWPVPDPGLARAGLGHELRAALTRPGEAQ